VSRAFFNIFKKLLSLSNIFSIKRHRSFHDNSFKLCCILLETCLKYDDSYHLYGEILFEELKVIRNVVTIKLKSSYMILNYLKTFDCFPNTCMMYRIILLIPLTLVDAENVSQN